MAWGPLLRHGDDEPFAVVQRQPRLPLGVGERRRAGYEEGGQHRQALGEIRIALPDRRHRRCVGPRSAHVAHQMDDRIALPDVIVELIQCLGAAGNEVLLHLDRNVRTIEVVAQGIAVATKLRADSGQEDMYVCHDLLPLRCFTVFPTSHTACAVAGNSHGSRAHETIICVGQKGVEGLWSDAGTGTTFIIAILRPFEIDLR